MQPDSPMSLMDAIYHRHSVRSYQPEPVGHSTIDTMLQAAVQAPTGLDLEPWAFVVVQDAVLLKTVSERVKQAFVAQLRRQHRPGNDSSLDHLESGDFNLFYNAGTLILLCTEKSDIFGPADCWLAAENLMLSACALGLGSCVIGSAIAGLHDPEVKTMLGVPDSHAIVVPIVVGKPACEGVPAPRQHPRVLAWK